MIRQLSTIRNIILYEVIVESTILAIQASLLLAETEINELDFDWKQYIEY